jgi:hypothetical protein
MITPFDPLLFAVLSGPTPPLADERKLASDPLLDIPAPLMLGAGLPHEEDA